jgi:hypothetical protein
MSNIQRVRRDRNPAPHLHLVPEDKTNTAEQTAIDFLQQLRPDGPGLLTAIDPEDRGITTETMHTEDEVASFVHTWNGRRNLYYSVNPVVGELDHKAAKADIAGIEYLFADLDPKNAENPEEAKQRYLAKLSEMRPTACIDSGNGIQALYRLKEPINLTTEAIADVESRTKELLIRLGAAAGTQNIDRILRLPGTVNLPSAAKRKHGRTKCQAKLLWFDDNVSFDLDAFPAPPARVVRSKPPGSDQETLTFEQDELDYVLTAGDGPGGDDRSKTVWWCVHEMLRRGYAPEKIEATLLDQELGISAHIYDQRNPQRCARKQVCDAIKKIDFDYAENERPMPTVENIHVGLLRLGVWVRYDRFADRFMLGGLTGFGPALSDLAVNRLSLTLARRFKLRISRELLWMALQDGAQLNGFHPVLDYLDSLQWDGVPRLDTWLIKYAGAVDTEYTRAVGALMLTAAVRRVRKPAVKFDEMVVFEGPQGVGKSRALGIMAVEDEWFSDDLPLHVRGKEVIEHLLGKWIVEAAELSGMRKVEIQHLKALLSRRYDRGRMAYARSTSEVPRQSIVVGTTNDRFYLRDPNGNRRFWPVRTPRFNLKALRQDRDQLWAEAAQREAAGVPIRLHSSLWSVATIEQDKRTTKDPYTETLHHHLGGYKQGKITTEDLWTILDAQAVHRSQDQGKRLGDAMRALGWRRNSAGTIKADGRDVAGWVKGTHPWRRIVVRRTEDGLATYQEPPTTRGIFDRG